MDLKNIGNFIEYLRKQKGLTQLELAKLLKVKNKVILKLENGKKIPDVLLLTKLSEIFDVSVNELLNGGFINDDNYKETLEKNTINMLKYSDEITKKKKKTILGFIVSLVISFLIIGSIGVSFILFASSEWQTDLSFVDERNIKEYEYILKELDENELSDDDFRKLALLEVKEMEEEFVWFLNDDQTISSYVLDLEEEYKKYFYEKHINFSRYDVTEGDYYNLAKEILIEKNKQLNLDDTYDYLDSIYSIMELFMNLIFIILYITYIIYYVIFIKFTNKRFYVKATIKYGCFLLGIFLFNCLSSLLLDVMYNTVGRSFSEFFGGVHISGSILDMGIFNIGMIFMMIVGGIILNLLFNIKNMYKFYKKDNTKEVNCNI